RKHPAHGNVPEGGEDIFRRRALMDEELAVAVEDEDVAAAMPQVLLPHLAARCLAHDVIAFVNHVDELVSVHAPLLSRRSSALSSCTQLLRASRNCLRNVRCRGVNFDSSSSFSVSGSRSAMARSSGTTLSNLARLPSQSSLTGTPS